MLEGERGAGEQDEQRRVGRRRARWRQEARGKRQGRESCGREQAQETRAGLGVGEKAKKGGLYTIYPTAQDASSLLRSRSPSDCTATAPSIPALALPGVPTRLFCLNYSSSSTFARVPPRLRPPPSNRRLLLVPTHYLHSHLPLLVLSTLVHIHRSLSSAQVRRKTSWPKPNLSDSLAWSHTITLVRRSPNILIRNIHRRSPAASIPHQ